jgi:hypothetical protein
MADAGKRKRFIEIPPRDEIVFCAVLLLSARAAGAATLAARY